MIGPRVPWYQDLRPWIHWSPWRACSATPAQLAIVVPFPFIVWGADEIRRLLLRYYRARRQRSLAR